MGIEQIRMNQTKALPPVPQFNWSQMESGYAKSYDSVRGRQLIAVQKAKLAPSKTTRMRHPNSD